MIYSTLSASAHRFRTPGGISPDAIESVPFGDRNGSSDIINHMVHHRGQLTVYLRLNDKKVPSIYGPSADSGGFSNSQRTPRLNLTSYSIVNGIRFLIAGLVATLIAASFAFTQADRLQGTLVVAVPVDVGLVVCADKRLNNAEAGTFSDDNVKVRRAGPDAVFAATHTVGFYDRKSEKMAFDAFKTTQDYVDKNPFSNTKPFWDGLKASIRQQMFTYLSGKPYTTWPETDTANRGLLFNLIFYSISDGRPYSQTVKVLYEKKKMPVVTVMPPFAELVTTPKLSGKGRDVTKYLSVTPSVANDPAILKFDERTFTVATTRTSDAVEFAHKLFALTSTAVPEAQVSSTFDCALIDRNAGYRSLQP